MSKKITELKDFASNDAAINLLTAEQQHEWYIRIVNSLPALKKLGPTDTLEQAILSYKQAHNIE